MILNVEENDTLNDIEVIIKCPPKNRTAEHIISFINSFGVKIENNIKQINASDIYYIESIEKMAVIFCEKESYKTKYRLYQLHEELAGLGFVQISKYCLLNIYQLDRIKPLFNSRMEAVLKNGKHLLITRKYLDDIKEKLQGIYNVIKEYK